ncbi:MAG: hypothetical protein Q4C99_04550 [Clostridia bacterium]|nr:hypothetical protein [Clostridia bacterium]
MTKLCYEKAKEIYNNDYLKSIDLAQEISDTTGMNVNTANMNIISIVQMLKGEGYNRILSSDSLDICLELIYEEYGRGGLGKALYATKQHIIYLNSIGTSTGKLLAVYNKYENKLK